MRLVVSLALVASVSVFGMASVAQATVTTTPYNPGAPTDLSQFVDGNELAAQTVTYQADANGKGVDIIVQVDPAGLGNDQADTSLGDQFTNLYFGDATNGATIGFEVGNGDAFVPGVPGSNVYYGASAGITYVDTPGTSYANGGAGSKSVTYIPYADFTTNVLGLSGFTPYAAGDALQLRDLQAFSYAGDNAGGGARYGYVTLGAVPEPGAWGLMLLGLGGMGLALRSQRRQSAAAIA